jgi:hypothetical protein
LDAGIAIYWDFENVHACVLDELRGEGAYRTARFRPQEPVVDFDPVVEYAATLGRIVVHRAYANWQYFGRYRDEMQAHAVDLVQLFPLTASKNGADIRLVLDVAEDMQQQAHVTHVIVVASDSDYTRWPSAAASKAGCSSASALRLPPRASSLPATSSATTWA